LPVARIIDEAHGGQVLAKKEPAVPFFKREPNDRYWRFAVSGNVRYSAAVRN
jgi:hypothetical protein